MKHDYPDPPALPAVRSEPLLDLRDRFALAALPGWIAHQCGHQNVYGSSQEMIARWCYETADAMLAQRDKPNAGAQAPSEAR
jgi:hypothetical protein